MINLKQYGLLHRKYAQTHNMSLSAKHAGVDRKTARKYVQTQIPPDQLQQPHTWRTRPDPLVGMWPEAQRMLDDAPELEAKALFQYFLEKPGSGLQLHQLRTFQRRVNHWRGTHGPDKEVYFPQRHCPGELMQLDWTHAKELEVTVGGRPLDHLLCHCVLTHSNWQWVKRCRSESFLSLVSGLQAALGRLGKKPRHLGTDHSSAATHEIHEGSGPRSYNTEYLDLCDHYGLLPVTINVACPHEHGDVESQNGHVKRRLRQHLLLRGSRDFDREEDYDQFLEEVMEKANKARLSRLAEDLAAMEPLPASKLAEYREVDARVSRQSTIRVKHITYSVPSRLIGQRLRVQVHESVLKLYLGREPVLELPRATGDRGAVINWRDMVGPLLRKPGAFLNYQHREQLYPTVGYRAAFDRLVRDHGARQGVIEYLHVLKLAIDHTLEKVEAALAGWMAASRKWGAAELRAMLAPAESPVVRVAELAPSLEGYDQLLHGSQACQEVVYVD